MATIGNFSIDRSSDGTVTFSVTPPVAIGGMSLNFLLTKRLGGVSGLYQAFASSGIPNPLVSGSVGSGITILNSGAGLMQINIPSAATSGLDPGSYAFRITRTDSGFYTTLAEGFLVLLP